jgi:hypothetical protein
MSDSVDRTERVAAPNDLRQMFRWWRDKARDDAPCAEAQTSCGVEEALPFPILEAMVTDDVFAGRVAARARMRAHLIATGQTVDSLHGREWEALTAEDILLGGWTSAGTSQQPSSAFQGAAR